jgi:DNA repair protein RadC
MAFLRDVLGHYTLSGPNTEAEILQAAEDILRRRMERQGRLSDPEAASDFLRMRIGHLPHEEFHAVWLDSQHAIIAAERLFTGSISSTEVHPREIVRKALQLNAAAVILAHNHPSGLAEPSQADRLLTTRLIEALGLIAVRVLDHIIVGATTTTSMAQRGML